MDIVSDGRKPGRLDPAGDVSSGRPVFATLTIILGAGTALIGILGIIGLISGITAFSGVFPGYRTIALSASVIWIIVGSVLACHAATPLRGTVRTCAAAVVTLIAIFAVIEFSLNISGTHFIVEIWSVRIADTLSAFPTMPISPVAVAFYVPIAVALFFMLYDEGLSKEGEQVRDFVGITGLVVSVVSFTFVMSYFYGTPFLYNTPLIPIAFTSASAALLTGAGLVTAAGSRAIPLRYFTGTSTHALLLRTFLPLILIIIFFEDLVNVVVRSYLGINDALLISISLVFFSLVTIYAAVKVSKGVSNRLDLAEEALRESKALVDAVVENVPLMIFLKEAKDLRFVIFNRAGEELLGYDRTALFGRNNLDLFPPGEAEQFMTKDREVLEGDAGFLDIPEEPITTAKKGVRLLHTRKVCIRGADGTTKFLMGISEDITERKKSEDLLKRFSEELEEKVRERTDQLQVANLDLEREVGEHERAEEQIRASLDEKVILLREIQHRVKNNLQIIISLLNLQSRYIGDDKIRQALRESQNRVMAISHVHEKLFQSPDITKIGLDSYIRFLGDNLFPFYGMIGKGIVLTTRIRDLHIGLETAIPVGLIVNELISNSLKHAFPDGRKGEISVAITQQNAMLTIQYKDNGVGIPQDFDWRHAESLGLQLVILLVDQLDGTIELDRSSGTVFTIVVKEKE